MFVLDASRVSDTQTHQIAARKEKQMEVFKAALGIGSPGKNQKPGKQSDHEENNDDEEPENFPRIGDNTSDKVLVGDALDEQYDREKGVKSKKNEVQRDGNKSSKLKKKYDSSDSDSSREHVKRSRKKHEKIRGSHHDDESSSDSESGRRHAKQNRKKHHRQTSDSDDKPDTDVQKIRRQSSGKHKKNRRYDSEDSEYADEKDDTSRWRGGLDDEIPTRVPDKIKQVSRSRLSDSKYNSDIDSGDDYKTKQGGSRNVGYRQEKSDAIPGRYKETEIRQKDETKYDVRKNFDSDERTKHGQKKLEKNRSQHVTHKHESDSDSDSIEETPLKNVRRQRHDSDDDSSIDTKSKESHDRSNTSYSDSDTSDYKGGKVRKPSGQREVIAGSDSRGKSGGYKYGASEQKSRAVEYDRRKEKDLPRRIDDVDTPKQDLSRKDTAERLSRGSRDTREKRKLADDKEDDLPEAKSRRLIYEKGTERSKDLPRDTKTETNNKSHRSRSDLVDDEYRMKRSGGEREDKRKIKDEDHRERKQSRDEDDEKERNYKRGEDGREDRRKSKDEDDRLGRGENEEERYKKHDTTEELQLGRYGRQQEGRHDNRSHEKDRPSGHFKRARYEDSRSTERYANEKRDDRRSRR